MDHRCWNCGKFFTARIKKEGSDLVADCPECNTTHIYMGKKIEPEGLIVRSAVDADGNILYLPKK
jgi:predicted  nucleic acid-binding Zn-ribbon protein